MASEISPTSLRGVKRQIYADLHGDIGTAVATSEALLELMVRGPDFVEGVAALNEKRSPTFADPTT
jgi:enoyl-CoA hydratase/carnithine racemase